MGLYCIHALGLLSLLICVPNGGAQQLKIKRESNTAGREAKLRAGQGYKLLTLVAGLSPAMHALAARVNKTPKNNFASAQRSLCFLFGET